MRELLCPKSSSPLPLQWRYLESGSSVLYAVTVCYTKLQTLLQPTIRVTKHSYNMTKKEMIGLGIYLLLTFIGMFCYREFALLIVAGSFALLFVYLLTK